MAKESQRVGNLLKEARGKKSADLNIDLIELRKAQFSLRLQRATGQAAKPDQFGKTRRDIARLKTVQRQLRAHIVRDFGVAKSRAKHAGQLARVDCSRLGRLGRYLYRRFHHRRRTPSFVAGNDLRLGGWNCEVRRNRRRVAQLRLQIAPARKTRAPGANTVDITNKIEMHRDVSLKAPG